MSLSLSQKNVIHNDSAYAFLMHTLMDEPRLLPKTFFKRDFFSETATKEKISLRERLFNSELKKPLLDCIEKINHMLSEKSLIVAFADRKVHVKQAVLEQIPYLNEVFKEILAYEKPFDFTEHKVSDFPLQTFETLVKCLPFIEKDKLPKELINENLLSLFMLAAHLGLDVSMRNLRKGVVDHFKRLSFEKLCTLYRKTPFNHGQYLVLIAIANKFFKLSCLETGIAFLNAKDQKEACLIWKSASFSKKILCLPCYDLVEEFLKKSGAKKHKIALDVIQKLRVGSQTNYTRLFKEKAKLAKALMSLTDPELLELEKKLAKLEFSFFKNLTRLVYVYCDIKQLATLHGEDYVQKIYRIVGGFTSWGYVIKASNFLETLSKNNRFRILETIAWGFYRQNAPQFTIAENLVGQIPLKQRSEALAGLSDAYLNQYPPLFKNAEYTADKILKNSTREERFRKIAIKFIKEDPLYFSEAMRLAKKIENEWLRTLRYEEMIEICLKQIPSLVENATKIAREIPRRGEKADNLQRIAMVYLKQNPPQFEEAIKVAKEIPDHRIKDATLITIEECQQIP